MSRVRAGLVALGVVCGIASIAAAELTAPTLAAFESYVRPTEGRMATEAAGASPFLWIDRQPAAAHARALADLTSGKVVVEKLETRDHGATIPVPNGLIHHWIGTVFIPGIPIDRVVTFVQDYAGYPAAFGPLVRSATVAAHDGDHFDVAMRTETHKVITVVATHATASTTDA